MTDEAETQRKLLMEKRSDGRHNTFVMHAIKTMDPEEKRFYRRVGLGMSVFGMVVPFTLEIALEDGLWIGGWTVAVLAFFAGLCFMFPALGMWLVQHLPSATDRLIPNKVREVLTDRSP